MKKTFLLLISIITFSVTNSSAQNLAQFFDEADAIFSKYVSNGKVDYASLFKNEAELASVLDLAKNSKVSTSNAATYQAFWINAYNLSVIKGIIDNYPIKSPLDKKGFFDKTTYNLGGTTITLNDIENKKLRAKFDDARFHFVLVCGAKGCPPLIAKAYRPETLNKQLEAQTKKALTNNEFVKISNGKVALSEIFKWYKEDFVKKGQNEVDFLNKFRNEKVSPDAKVTYYTYDWRLNSK
ncbi:DUF547 domain-containing protein [Patiriisocius hiemis]|uniref:DUF547 domain-containing protein n=1 Tax=Patiriisocius hiemis TaxID=3075604 RepID=A0ABU2YDN2_9FLAO|nr:DUF547 domain-containing protein [Constantimarinum sp. W242]MDT0556297.1 DUF547 domain-containing protein [Constantimarinum sp. W242]